MPKTVLLIEDILGDIRLAIEAFQETNKSVKLRVVPDGVATMSYLRRERKYADAPPARAYLVGPKSPQNGWSRISGSHQGR